MINWCVSNQNYETLEKIFDRHTSTLLWWDQIKPLLEELDRGGAIPGSYIPKHRINGAPIRVKVDTVPGEELIYGDVVISTVIQAVSRRLDEAGVNPMTLRRQRAGFTFSFSFIKWKWCNPG